MIDPQSFARDLSNAVSFQNKKLFSRVETSSHKSFIRNAKKFHSDDAQFVSMLKSVFSHHDTANFEFIAANTVDAGNPEHVSRLFHHHRHYYMEPTIHQGQLYDNPTLSYDELYDRLIPHGSYEGQNLLSFLIGRVGIGKTTFICNFICRQISRLKKDGYVPVKVNLDVSANHGIPDDLEVLEIVKRSIISTLKNNSVLNGDQIERLARDCRLPREADRSEIDANLAHLTSLLHQRHAMRVFLIIDNIDFLYHLGDRGFFAEGGDQHPEREQVRRAHATIVEIIKMFWLQTDRSSSRLGIPVLFACREDTIAFLISQHHEVPLEGVEERLFTLAPPELSRAKEVVGRRFDLLEELANTVKEAAKQDEFLKQIRRLRELYQQRSGPGQALLDDLWSLSRKGLRDMINQIAEFSWLEFLDGQKSDLNSRFTQQYYPSMLAYMLAGRRRYTQFSGNVPNIYLINAPSPSKEVGVPSDFKDNHLYTIWLKKLILAYLKARKDILTTDGDIIRVFCGRNGRGYSESLVRYILSSLFEVPTSELISVDVGAEGSSGSIGYIKHIEITERGEFLLDKLADSFKYLQLCVDDWKVLFPSDLLSHFDYRDPDYSYLVFDEEDYGSCLQKILEDKGRQTFMFAILIEEMLVFEKKTWPNVYRRLEAVGAKYYQSEPPTSTIREEIQAVRNSTRGSAELTYLNAEVERRIRALFAAKLEDLFAPCRELTQKYY